MIAIGLDPSLTGFGWSVLFERAVLACGVFRTEKGEGKVADDNALRFDFIARGLVEVLDNQYAVGEPVLFVEAVALPHGRAPAKTALAQGRARGLVDGIAAARRLRLVEVPTHTVKAIVPTFKRRKVDKPEVRDRVLELYPAAASLLPGGAEGPDWTLNATDAIAIAHQGLELVKFHDSLRSGSSW